MRAPTPRIAGLPFVLYSKTRRTDQHSASGLARLKSLPAACSPGRAGRAAVKCRPAWIVLPEHGEVHLRLAGTFPGGMRARE